ncbi:Na+/H+ antiporter NhaA [Taibaiella soli]|uniref:Na(+)/H(+) antiporter NhaA n=1 Tax=Taibaiella soli TaxID=1649169 RepID=A0A2W2AJQ0_9BACT|nr:Na+/H+ antiporter NhaA [Taibaiella soli]PZF72460.1 Na+/H+ antiporter NhaA [Taibaiella soli]
MLQQPKQLSNFRQKFLSPVQNFFLDSKAIGVILIGCTIISLLLSNTGWSNAYTSFWEKELPTSATVHLPHSILHFINDGLMFFFFLLVGMEIKRELLIGELSSIKKSLLPVIAALGGMMVPALIYTAWCGHTPFYKGWGIPMATDIAFSLGVLSLLGNRIPASVRIFLTALAIIDDLGGILTIAVFYAGNLNFTYLGLAGIIFGLLIVLNLFKVTQTVFHIGLGLLLWYFVYNSGVHATIAGVILAFTIPLKKITSWEHFLHYPVYFFIMPLFALANTAIVLPAHLQLVLSSEIHQGIFTGLLLGKPIGIYLFSLIAVKFKLASLPDGMSWKHLTGMGMLAGIGFTMSIFMATLAFAEEEQQLIAKVAILNASFVAGIVGYFYLRQKSKVKN